MERQLLDEAYRKLKGSVYMDKTLPYLRSDIAKFENENFDNRMSYLLESINDENKWLALEYYILKSIKAFTFPKKLCVEKKADHEPIVISNVCSESICVEKYNNFIDLSVEGHIIGVLWILLVGHKIDKDLYDNCLGNRLRDNLVFSNKLVSESPNLFKPYYSQYESWRSQGLKIAKKEVNQENQSVIITMLDLTRYYYNINYTKLIFQKITKSDTETIETNKINSLVYKILQKYSILLGFKNKIILPIGFLPSNILANAYLLEFDKRIANCKNTVYYGRYVDDMILITRVEPKKQLKNKILKKGVSVISDFMLKILKDENIIYFKPNNNIGIVGYEELDIQKDKFRFFYIDKNGYDTIIEKIKSDITHNTSEFNFMPENAVNDLNEDILQLEREDTVNKLRAVNGVTIDKYALSKAIGKNVKMSQYAEEKAINLFIQNIDQLLNHKEIISNYTLWEGVVNYYVINQKWKKIVEFSSKIISALKELDEYSSKNQEYEYLNNRDNIYSVGDTLIIFFIACLTRSMSIVWGKKIKKILIQISSLFSKFNKYTYFQANIELKTLTNMRKYYCNSRMINYTLIPLLIEECMNAFPPSDNSDKVISFNQLNQYFLSKENHRYSKENAKFKPYISSPFNILYTLLIKEIKDNKTKLFDDSYCINYACERYAKNFNKIDEEYLNGYLYEEKNDYEENIIITVKSQENYENNGQYRIAVANVKMVKSDIEDIFNGKQRDISKRCSEISKIVNEAIRNKSDVLIFPEAYIPITFLPIIQAKAALYNMAIIGGIEHIKKGNLVYNLTTTLLPIVNQKIRYTIPFFHAKVFYSPEEEKGIKAKNCIPVTGKGHTLFRWKGLSFITYCCYELTSLEERSKFKREADIVFGIEWNKDTLYFSNIMESLSRDRCCFCAQSNMSEYGDSRIIQPTSSVKMNIARVKGGINGLVIIDEIDVNALRKHKSMPNVNDDFKPLPAGY